MFADSEKEKCLDVLRECGLPVTGFWWGRFPRRAIEEIYKMEENTSAIFSHREGKLIWEEEIINNFGTGFLISIETGSNYPFSPPKVYVKESGIDLQSLCAE